MRLDLALEPEVDAAVRFYARAHGCSLAEAVSSLLSRQWEDLLERGHEKLVDNYARKVTSGFTQRPKRPRMRLVSVDGVVQLEPVEENSAAG